MLFYFYLLSPKTNLIVDIVSRNSAYFWGSACVAKSQPNFIAVVIISCAVPYSYAPVSPLSSHVAPLWPDTRTRWSYAVLRSSASRAHSDSNYKNINNTNKDNFRVCCPVVVATGLLLVFLCDFHIYLYVFTLAKLQVQVHTWLTRKTGARRRLSVFHWVEVGSGLTLRMKLPSDSIFPPLPAKSDSFDRLCINLNVVFGEPI